MKMVYDNSTPTTKKTCMFNLNTRTLHRCIISFGPPASGISTLKYKSTQLQTIVNVGLLSFPPRATLQVQLLFQKTYNHNFPSTLYTLAVTVSCIVSIVWQVGQNLVYFVKETCPNKSMYSNESKCTEMVHLKPSSAIVNTTKATSSCTVKKPIFCLSLFLFTPINRTDPSNENIELYSHITIASKYVNLACSPRI